VSGRGALLALRIGDQPYGIYPTTDFARVNWFGREEQAGNLGRLYGILRRIEEDWRPLVGRVSFIGKNGGDPHQILLDVLGLHPGSVEYYPLRKAWAQILRAGLWTSRFRWAYWGFPASAVTC
jgi:hypothetical protein